MTCDASVVREGHLEADRNLALDMFRRYLNPQYDAARFDWVYRQNPHGPGRLWVSSDLSDGSVIGIAGAFPRRVYLAGRECEAWVLGDFCVSDRHRSIGPALALQRACLADVAAGAIPFCYDFPSLRMMAIYRRLGIDPLGHMVRLRRLLRVDSRVSRMVGRPALSRRMSALGNLLLARRIPRAREVPGLTVSLHDGQCGEEFSEVAARWASQHGVSVQRSAEYLNWRYLANPLQRHEVMTARSDGTLVGYAVFTREGHAACLVDMLAGDTATVLALVRAVVGLGWRRGMETVTITLLAAHPWVGVLERVGFRAGETSPVVVYASPAASRVGVADGAAWLLLHGDRDS
jgi:hypothetical protein